jgi:23S rRNA (uracil1939-C5)-methyltransferase
LLDAWVTLRAAWGEGARLLPRGESLRLTLRQDRGGIVLVVEGGEARWSAEPLLEASGLAAIWHRPDGGSATRSGSDVPRSVRLKAGSTEAGSPTFSQVNPEVAEAMVEHVLGLVASAGATGHRRAADAYSGMGEYARRLAAAGWNVSAIELDPVACEAARKASGDSYVVLEGRVEDRIPEVLPADLLIVNPPRAGLGPEVVGAITAAPPERMVYVSCDPATLARDVAGLGERYAIRSIACFDLFPQTAHVETVMELHFREGPREGEGA